MRVLVIGSEGFIGKHVCKELERNGYKVIRFDKVLGQNLLYDDIPEADYIIHLAALVGLKSCFERPYDAVIDNVVATTMLYESIGGRKLKKIVHVSTWAVEGNNLNPYDSTKRCGESLARHYAMFKKLPITICRLGTAYGMGMSKYGVIPQFLNKASRGEPLVIHGRGEQIRQFTHAEDIARGILIAMRKGKVGETYQIVTDEVVSIKELAKIIGKKIKYTKSRKADEDYKILDADKLRKLGWKPQVKLIEGLWDV